MISILLLGATLFHILQVEEQREEIQLRCCRCCRCMSRQLCPGPPLAPVLESSDS